MSTWKAEQAYNHLPLLPPKQDIESKAILRQCIRARAALAELKQAAELTHNMYQIEYTLPQSKHSKSMLLKMDEKQQELMEIVNENF